MCHKFLLICLLQVSAGYVAWKAGRIQPINKQLPCVGYLVGCELPSGQLRLTVRLAGVLIGYYIVIQQQIVPFMPEDDSTLGDKKLWAAVAACVAIPLCFLNTKYLSFTSTLSVVVNVYLFGVLIALLSDGVSKEEHKFCWVGFGPGIVTFSSLMQYGVIIQFCVVRAGTLFCGSCCVAWSCCTHTCQPSLR